MPNKAPLTIENVEIDKLRVNQRRVESLLTL